MTQNESLQVLDDLNAGRITTEEAEEKLAALDDGTEPNGGTHTLDFEPPKKAWIVPVMVGLGTTGMSGLFIKGSKSLVVRLLLAPFLLLGTGLTVLGFWSRSSHWIHVHVQSEGQNIKVSLPFPVQFTSWILARLEPLIAGDVDLKGMNLAQQVREMGDELSVDNPLVVEVDDDDTIVRVYIT